MLSFEPLRAFLSSEDLKVQKGLVMWLRWRAPSPKAWWNLELAGDGQKMPRKIALLIYIYHILYIYYTLLSQILPDLTTWPGLKNKGAGCLAAPRRVNESFLFVFLKFASRCGFGVIHYLFHLNQGFKFTSFSKAFCSSFQMYCFFPCKLRVFFKVRKKMILCSRYTYTHICIFIYMHISIYLSIYLSVYLSIYLPIYLSIYLFIYLSTYLPTYLSISMCLYMERSILWCQCEKTTTCRMMNRLVLFCVSSATALQATPAAHSFWELHCASIGDLCSVATCNVASIPEISAA